MKPSIQQEAEKAAKKIREALEEFNRATGCEAQIEVDWRSSNAWGSPGSTVGGHMDAWVDFSISGFAVTV